MSLTSVSGWRRGVYRVAMAFVIICVFALMMLTTVDVVGRYFFGTPLRGAFELTELLLPAMIFGALPLVTLEQRHIVVDLAGALVPRWARRLQHTVTHVLSAVVLAAIVPDLWAKVIQMRSYGETTAVLELPVLPLVVFITAMTVLTSLAFLVAAFRPTAAPI